MVIPTIDPLADAAGHHPDISDSGAFVFLSTLATLQGRVLTTTLSWLTRSRKSSTGTPLLTVRLRG